MEKMKDDVIYRQVAIDELLMRMRPIFATNQDIIESDAMIFVRNTLESLPSAQPEQCSDCIVHGGDWECDHMHCRKGRLPSAQPKRLIWEQKIKKASIHRYGNDVCCTILDHALDRTFGYKFCPMCGKRLIVRIEKQKGERNEAD